MRAGHKYFKKNIEPEVQNDSCVYIYNDIYIDKIGLSCNHIKIYLDAVYIQLDEFLLEVICTSIMGYLDRVKWTQK